MIIVTGSLAYDIILNLPGKFSSYILPDKLHQINVSFATDTHTKNFGGTAGNQAYSLALLGEQPVLFATAGNDFEPYKKFLEKHGVDTTYVKIIKNKLTASGFAITDEINNQVWGYSKAAMSDSKDHHLKPILSKISKNNKDILVVLTPCGEEGLINYVDECVKFGLPFAYDPAFYIPTLPLETLRKGVQNAQLVFGNDYEFELLDLKLKIKKYVLRSSQIHVTTLGENGSVIKYIDEKSKTVREIKVKAAKVKKVVDPTGAGDAYRSGFLAGYVKGLPLQVCGQMGSVASSFVIEQKGTVNHFYTVAQFKKRYKENFGPLSF